MNFLDGDLFDGKYHNYVYLVRRGEENVESSFSVSDFPLMNPNDFIVMVDQWYKMNQTKMYKHQNSTAGQNMIRFFLDGYLKTFANYHFEIVKLLKRTISLADKKLEGISSYSDGNILQSPWGVVTEEKSRRMGLCRNFF